MLLRDLVRGGEPMRVSEKLGSQRLRPWDRIATRVIPLREGAVISGTPAIEQTVEVDVPVGEVAALDAAEKALGSLVLDGDAPACVHDYARAHLVQRTTPTFNQRFNTIPVRVIIDAEGYDGGAYRPSR